MNHSQRNLLILFVVALIAVIAMVTYSLMSPNGIIPASTISYDSASAGISSTTVPFSGNVTTGTTTASTTIDASNNASSTGNGAIDISQFSNADIASWKSYSNPELGISLRYPQDLIYASNGNVISLIIPKAKYFHWPLQDTAKINITSGRTCPKLSTWGGGPKPADPVKFVLNSYHFTLNTGTDVGAGQLYSEMTYDTMIGNICYRFDFTDRGTNGAGFHVDDQSLIKKYDDQHAEDMKTVYSVFNSIVGSFRPVSTSDGIPEDQAATSTGR